MGISIAGSPVGIPPAFTYRNGFTIIEDFARADNLNLYPFEGEDGTDDFTLDESGVFADATNQGVYIANRQTLQQFGQLRNERFEFFLDEFASLRIIWGWHLTAFTTGAPELACAMGIGVASSNIGPCITNQCAGFYFTTDWVARCGAANSIPDNNIVPRVRNTSGVIVNYGAAQPIAPFLAQWNTSEIRWTRSAAQPLEFYLNGALAGQGAAPDWILNVQMKWSYNSLQAIAASPDDVIAFDWIKYVATMNR